VPSKFLSRLKLILWPIENKELKFFVPMAAMMMFALYNFASLRSIKDSLVVPNIGAESISFLKLWFVLPSAVLFTVIYFRLCNIFTMDKVFYIVTSCFLVFFLIFSLYLYPNKNNIHLDAAQIKALTDASPHLKWFIRIIGHWSFALMYIFSELWSVVIINLMFWQFANMIVETKSAKRFYPLFGLIGNFGLVLAGSAMVYFSNLTSVPKEIINTVANSTDQADTSLRLSIFSVIISGMIMILIMYYINKYVLYEKDLMLKVSAAKSKTKLSLSSSVRLVLQSRYIGMITLIIVCYGLAINVLEGPWKAKIKELYPTQREYLNFMGNFNIWMGASCISFMVIGSNIIRIFSWRIAALITPASIGITGVLFFTFVLFSAYSKNLLFNPVFAAVIAGGMQNILSKSIKYSLFDSTKELAYIPLGIELRTKGKAAAEVVGAKLGKSMGAVIQSGMFTIMPAATFNDVTPILMTIFVIVVIIWIIDIFYLDKEYTSISGENKN